MNEKVPLPPEVFEAIVRALAEALVTDYRARWNDSPPRHTPSRDTEALVTSPWLTVKEAANRARCSVKILYRAVNAGRLKVVRIGAGRNMRFRGEWVDQWLENTAARR